MLRMPGTAQRKPTLPDVRLGADSAMATFAEFPGNAGAGTNLRINNRIARPDALNCALKHAPPGWTML